MNASENAVRLLILITALTLAATACGGDADGTTTVPEPVHAGDVEAGGDIYKATCRKCHGNDLGGIPGLGLPLEPSEFVVSMSEEDLAAFITAGRTADDPVNTIGSAMPPKGGKDSLSAQDIRDVAAFLQSQNE